jgi:SET domain
MTFIQRLRLSIFLPFCLILSTLLVLYLRSSIGSEESWESCETFIAPSSLPSGGWGIYAAREFQKNEIVEISPRFLTFPHGDLAIESNVLYDYVYGYDRWNEEINDYIDFHCVPFGSGMYFNHHPESNIMWTSFGKEPTEAEPNVGAVTGFLARRNIMAGEELFAAYGYGEEGDKWFTARKLQLVSIPTYASRKNGTTYEEDKKKYCSKIHSGLSQQTWRSRIANIFHMAGIRFKASRMPLKDHPTAVAKQAVKAGEVLEISPALVLDRNSVIDTALAPSCFFWEHLSAKQHQDMKDLHANGDLRLQFQGEENEWKRADVVIENLEELVIFPSGGNIGFIDRVGGTSSISGEQANCEIRLLSSGSMKSHHDHGGSNGNTGVILQVIAIKDIDVEEELKLNIPRVMSETANVLLFEVLTQTGQLIPPYLESAVKAKPEGDEL